MQWERAFDTGDANDIILDGTEGDISIHATVGRSITLSDHNGAFNSVTPVTVRFVPSPATSDTMWCTNDCLIAVDPQTFDPTNDPTIDPTSDPTENPTNDPTENPTYDPTGEPTTEPTIVTESPSRSPVVDTPIEDNDSGANSKQTLLLFLIVIMTIFFI